jgi:hypothetical protein
VNTNEDARRGLIRTSQRERINAERERIRKEGLCFLEIDVPDLIPCPAVPTFHDGVDVVNIGNMAVIEELTHRTLDTALCTVHQGFGIDVCAGRISSPPEKFGRQPSTGVPGLDLIVGLAHNLMVPLLPDEIGLLDLGIIAYHDR